MNRNERADRADLEAKLKAATRERNQHQRAAELAIAQRDQALAQLERLREALRKALGTLE